MSSTDDPALIARLAEAFKASYDSEGYSESAIYIGDRSEDGKSADANALPFIAETWGYGRLTPAEMRDEWRAAARTDVLGTLLLGD
jgi:phosphoglycolate phosphatase